MTVARPCHAASTFIDALVALRFPNAFNPYSDNCPEHDHEQAAMIRRANLRQILEAAISDGVESVWVARDLGYRGGRRTGLALTDDVHLTAHAMMFGTPALERATRGPEMSERTASVIWRTIGALDFPVFLWNVFPFHPHEAGAPMSNRCHTHIERDACSPLLLWLLELLNPKSVVAIGREAHTALDHLGVHAVKVRHPSYGGQSEFVAGIASHYARSLERAE